MKKIFKSLVSMTMAFGMLFATACGDDGENKKPVNPTPAPTTDASPEITVAQSTLTMKVNDVEDFDWYADVTVTDDKDTNLSATIVDWGGLDAIDPQVGTYTITYKVTDSAGNEATATRTVTIEKAAAQIVVEAQKHRNSNGPETVLLPFELENYIELTADSATEYEKGSYVFHNDTTDAFTVSVDGAYAVAAIIDANGLAIEGRDGANANKIMNVANPIRSTSTATLGEEGKAGDSMTIPADGYAIIVQIGYLTDGKDPSANNDGRNFLAYNVIWRYKTPVRIYNTEAPTTYFTTYVDQSPVVEAPILSVGQGVSEADAKARAIEGLKIEDDNGTFELSDDKTDGFTVTVTDVGGYDGNTLGTYTFTLEVSDDNGNPTTFTRTVKVESKVMTLGANGNTISVNEETQFFILGASDSAPSSFKDAFYLVTPEFKAKNATFATANGHGEAIVLNQYGEIVRAYDGANAKYFDATIPNGAQNSGCTATGYLAEAYASLQEGEYLLIAPYAGSNTCRKFALDNCRMTIGQTITFTGTDKSVPFATKPTEE